MSDRTTKTTCPYCGVGCGVLASHQSDGTVAIAGDPGHPANYGRLCSKAAALGETLSLEDRVLAPLIHGERASWDTALDLVARRFMETLCQHGPGSIAFYVSGQLLTEDYYVANKLMKGFIGTANIDTNSRLCMASSVAGHKRAFGSDTVPGCYDDLDEADLVVLVGSNLAWCHPVLFQRLAVAKEKRGTKIVVIDPRRTATCEIADMHLAVTPGSDVALFNGLLVNIIGSGSAQRDFIGSHTTGFRASVDAAATMSMREIANATGISRSDLLEFYELFVRTERVVTVYSQGVNQSTAGADKVNAIINCHLATGRIGKPGMGPFSVTGQPNAMGGREVGGLANMLAAHMEIENAADRQRVQGFWMSPRIADKPGLKAVDMFRAVAEGRIKAIWIMATNPVDSMPEADSVRSALAACPFVVVSDVVHHTDTTAHAHVLLPSLAWGEKDGAVTNSERRISRQRAFLPAPGEARADWWQLAEVAKRMGWGEAFDWRSSAEIFDEHARLSALENNGTRDFDIGGLAGLTRGAYDALAPVQWPQPATRIVDGDRASMGAEPARIAVQSNPSRMFADGQFFTQDRRARFIATPFRKPASAVCAAYPLSLNTGRIRDQWHTMTRTAKSARLMSHIAEPFVEINPRDAVELGLAPAQLVIVESRHGRVVVRTLVTERVQPGHVFMPIHWTDQIASSARIDALIAAHVDPVSGQPELKYTPVRVAPFAAAWYGFAVSAAKPASLSVDYWAIARTAAGWRTELGGLSSPGDGSTLFHRFLQPSTEGEPAEIIAYHDQTSGTHRLAAIAGGRLEAALFIAPHPVTAARDYLADLLDTDFTDPASRLRLLAGRPPAGTPERGPIVCACMDVGRNQILAAIASGACASIDAIGQATRAGANCGSCRPEIGALLETARAKAG